MLIAVKDKMKRPASIRKIVDSNALQSEALMEYLAKSSTNFAVLNDYAAMEAYKGDTLSSIFHSMAILAKFPKQVIVLKPTGKICALRGRSDGLQRRMIDERQTRDFPAFCRDLNLAESGDEALRRQLLINGRVADDQMNRILTGAPILQSAIKEVRKQFTPEELKIIRLDSPFPETLIKKAMNFITGLTVLTVSRHPFPPPPIRNHTEMVNTFLFRHAVCMFVWTLDWIARGGADNVRPAKLRNDVIDLVFATYATYFDGFLCNDKKAFRIYNRSLFIIMALQGFR